jgi:hypothetical protein
MQIKNTRISICDAFNVCNLLLGVISASILLASCSSYAGKEMRLMVLENSLQTNQSPAWVLDDKEFSIDKDTVFYKYSLRLDSSNNSDSCIQIAKTKGIAAFMNYIQTKVSAGQQVEQQNSQTDSSYQALLATLSQGRISGVVPSKTYWARVLVPTGTETQTEKLDCAVLLTIPKAILQQQMINSMSGTAGGNPDVKKAIADKTLEFLK